jgi:hypothetical protein
MAKSRLPAPQIPVRPTSHPAQHASAALQLEVSVYQSTTEPTVLSKMVLRSLTPTNFLSLAPRDKLSKSNVRTSAPLSISAKTLASAVQRVALSAPTSPPELIAIKTTLLSYLLSLPPAPKKLLPQLQLVPQHAMLTGKPRIASTARAALNLMPLTNAKMLMLATTQRWQLLRLSTAQQINPILPTRSPRPAQYLSTKLSWH